MLFSRIGILPVISFFFRCTVPISESMAMEISACFSLKAAFFLWGLTATARMKSGLLGFHETILLHSMQTVLQMSTYTNNTVFFRCSYQSMR